MTIYLLYGQENLGLLLSQLTHQLYLIESHVPRPTFNLQESEWKVTTDRAITLNQIPTNLPTYLHSDHCSCHISVRKGARPHLAISAYATNSLISVTLSEEPLLVQTTFVRESRAHSACPYDTFTIVTITKQRLFVLLSNLI